MSLVKQLERQIEESKVLADRRQKAMRLATNPEFKALFMDGFFRDEAARLVQLAGDPALDDRQRKDALEMALATGHTKRYLSMTITMGAHAEESLPAMEQELELLRAEENEDQA